MPTIAPGRRSAVLAGLSGALLRYRRQRTRHVELLALTLGDPLVLTDAGARAPADALRRRNPTLLFDRQQRPGGW